MKRFEVRKRVLVQFEPSAEIPSDLTDQIGGGARTHIQVQCQSYPVCATFGEATCQNTCRGNTCVTCLTCMTGCGCPSDAIMCRTQPAQGCGTETSPERGCGITHSPTDCVSNPRYGCDYP